MGLEQVVREEDGEPVGHVGAERREAAGGWCPAPSCASCRAGEAVASVGYDAHDPATPAGADLDRLWPAPEAAGSSCG